MAVGILNSAQTGTSATATLTITSATAGNLLVAFVAQIGASSASMTDNTGSGTWVFNATPSTYNTTWNLWVGTKVAAGGEVTLTSAGGTTMEGIACWELTGAHNVLENVTATAGASANTGTLTQSTTTTGDMVLMGFGFGAGASGTITNPMTSTTGTVATPIVYTSSRCMGASYLTTTPLSSATFTAAWVSARTWGILGVGVKATVAATNTGNMFACL